MVKTQNTNNTKADKDEEPEYFRKQEGRASYEAKAYLTVMQQSYAPWY